MRVKRSSSSTTAIVMASLENHFFSALAYRMVDALSSATAGSIEGIEQELRSMAGALLDDANPQVIGVIHGLQKRGAVAEAFALGQISFAQQLAASAASVRIDEPFLKLLTERKFAPYLKALLVTDRTNTELARIAHCSEENVRRRVHELREAGVTEFRRDGTQIVNFLTPVARQVLGAHKTKPG